jgi:hypothetical protein
MNWIAFYFKPLPESEMQTPLDTELHSFPCEGETAIEAIENLEKDYRAPFRIFHLDTVPEAEAKDWIEQCEAESKRIGCLFKLVQHGRAI